jgi:hypothetical protein
MVSRISSHLENIILGITAKFSSVVEKFSMHVIVQGLPKGTQFSHFFLASLSLSDHDNLHFPEQNRTRPFISLGWHYFSLY